MTFLLSLLISLSASAQNCGSPRAIYKSCADQVEIYEKAVEQAKAEKKLLFVVVGSEWCPRCIQLNRMNYPDAINNAFLKVPIALRNNFELVPSGFAVLRRLGRKEAHRFPILFVVNPQNGRKVMLNFDRFKSPYSSGGLQVGAVSNSLIKAGAVVTSELDQQN